MQLLAESYPSKDGGLNLFLRLIKTDHPRLNLIMVGDDLFSRQPFISEVLSMGNSYIFTVKPDSHKYLMEWINAYDSGDINRVTIPDTKGRRHVYEWVNGVPLNGREDSIETNFFRYQIITKDKRGNEKVSYKSSWVTNIEITEKNIKTLVKGGRCRWKIENECFNTLKNQGYHLEHNYGHGKKNLCFNFFLFTLLAFYLHQIFELTDHLYQSCRKKFGSKRNMWENLRSYIRILIFNTWEHLLDFAITPGKYNLSFLPP